jgi:CheY-like chemotaxis protein/signal transduction histidine kinase/PAS domain-containing protein
MRFSFYRGSLLASLLTAAVAMLLAILAGTAPAGPPFVVWMVAIVATVGAAAGISWFFTLTCIDDLRQLGSWLTSFVRGEDNLPDPPTVGSSDCLQLKRDFQHLAAWQREITETCWAAREGKSSRLFLEGRGERDQLAVAFNSLIGDLHQANSQYLEAISYLHSIPTPVQVVDRDLTVRFINRAGARSARLSVGQCIGKKCHELFRTRDCNSDRCKVARAMVQDRSLSGENIIITPKGEAPYRYTAAPLKDEHGRIIGAVEYIVDIRDEMKVVELAEAVSKGNYEITIPLRSEDDRLSQALNRMADTLREMAGKQETERWLAAASEAVGDRLHGEHDLVTLAHNILEVLVDVLDAQVAAFYLAQDQSTLRLLKTYGADETLPRQIIGRDQGIIGRALHQEKVLVINDLPPDYLRISSGLGETRAAGLVVAPLYFENRLLAVIELGRHQPFSQREGALLELVLENIGVAIQTTEARLETARLLATTREQSEKLQVQQEELQQANEELQEQTRALSISEGRLQAQQEELRVSNEELAERSSVLVEKNKEVEAANLKLLRAQQELEEKAAALELSGRYKSEFLANMSHELRTPLNSILILSQMLAANKEQNLLAKQVEFATTIHNSGSDLLKLINEVLDLSKIEAGRMEINPEEITLETLLSSLLAPFKPLAEEKGLKLELKRGGNAPAVIFTDDTRLRQVLNNLLSNAFKFTEQGVVGLTVGRPAAGELPPELSLADPAKIIYFRVRDSGIGIPLDKQEIVFEAFKQADGTTSRKFGGTGLGLSISRELAKLLGGVLTLESSEGKGSAFTLWLPENFSATRSTLEEREKGATKEKRNTGVTAAANAPAAATETSPPNPDHGSGKLVRDDRRKIRNGDKVLLIIEDDPVFASLLLDLAREKSYRGLIAEDGETGLHLADYYRPSAILLDMGLPGISGREVLERLKNNADTRHIPVHFISASDQSSEIMPMGAIGYLTKPVTMEKLEQVFARIERLVATPVKRLLIVEDDLVQRQAIKALIGNGDVTVVEASSGEEAYRMLKAEHFDCMILDLGLGDMSGFDLLARVKENREISRVPVVVYTGREIDQNEEERLQQYANSIIIKGARSPERLLDETTLFLHRVEKNLPRDQQEILNTLHHRESTFTGRTILVVDDDMRNVFALSSVLEEQGLNIVVARNGLESIEKLVEHPETELVLMDIMMPEMDGYQAMRQIRKDPGKADLPIIALTAKAMRGDRDKCLTAGANDYLAKPVDPEKLVSLLRVWLYR